MNDIQQQLEQARAPGQSGLHSILVIFLMVFVFGVASLLGFSACMKPSATKDSLQREVEAMAWMSFRPSSTTETIQGRANWWAKHTAKVIPSVPQDEVTGAAKMFDEGLAKMIGGHPDVWWNEIVKVNLGNFLPTLMLRLEVIVVTFTAFISVVFMTFFLGERYARFAMREGRRKGDHRHKWTFFPVKFTIFAVWVIPFWPIAPPVVYWVGIAYLVTALGIVWVRANTIEV
jgi:hypothetical protein